MKNTYENGLSVFFKYPTCVPSQAYFPGGYAMSHTQQGLARIAGGACVWCLSHASTFVTHTSLRGFRSEDRVMDGPASGGKNSNSRNQLDCTEGKGVSALIFRKESRAFIVRGRPVQDPILIFGACTLHCGSLCLRVKGVPRSSETASS